MEMIMAKQDRKILARDRALSTRTVEDTPAEDMRYNKALGGTGSLFLPIAHHLPHPSLMLP